MDAKELRRLRPELARFLSRFDDCFDTCCGGHLPIYVGGQLSDLDRKSVEPIAKRAGVAPRTLQEFLALLTWDHTRLRDRLQTIVATEHGGPHRIGLIDETSFVKKGTKTPGVQRQWCGHLGKVENCVVTVHLGYTQGNFQCLLDGEMFLPESWGKDRARCREAGIADEVVYRPKWRIALELYDRAVANGIGFEWLTFDEYYGGKPEFLRELSQRHQCYVAEVPKSVVGWLRNPRWRREPMAVSTSRGCVLDRPRRGGWTSCCKGIRNCAINPGHSTGSMIASKGRASGKSNTRRCGPRAQMACLVSNCT